MKILKALGDDTRLRILNRISRGEICACELPRMVKISQPAVSQHLKVLLDAGLVMVREDGAKRLYSLSRKGKKILSEVSAW
ncbi:MAG: metalloregulator ArsR/SmtB family transcription factor [Candidatus Micrarchaeota archaeon]|nr:metalloregulator ArsR/SmtB family transcription factor [Candidatus Micrarchaeota archaeon]